MKLLEFLSIKKKLFEELLNIEKKIHEALLENYVKDQIDIKQFNALLDRESEINNKLETMDANLLAQCEIINDNNQSIHKLLKEIDTITEELTDAMKSNRFVLNNLRLKNKSRITSCNRFKETTESYQKAIYGANQAYFYDNKK